jgi:streptogramin lyase
VGFGAAWVTNVTDTTVVRIDPDTHDPERIAEGTALALGPNSVWIANGKTLRRFDPETRKPIGRRFTLRFPATQLAVDEEGVVWVTHQGDDAVSRVDPAGGASQIEGVGDGPTGIAVGGGSVWVASSLGRSLIRIGPESRKVEQAIPLGSSPKGVVVAAGSVWVTTQAG